MGERSCTTKMISRIVLIYKYIFYSFLLNQTWEYRSLVVIFIGLTPFATELEQMAVKLLYGIFCVIRKNKHEDR